MIRRDVYEVGVSFDSSKPAPKGDAKRTDAPPFLPTLRERVLRPFGVCERGAETLRVEANGRADRLCAEANGYAGTEVIRGMGVSNQTFYRSKKVYRGLGVGDLRSCLALGIKGLAFISKALDR
jgi:hypothetical protein